MEFISDIAIRYWKNTYSKTKIEEYNTLRVVSDFLNKDIIKALDEFKFYSIYVVGKMGSGKTTLATSIEKDIRKELVQKSWSFVPLKFTGKDIAKVKEEEFANILEIASRTNPNYDVYIIVLDDISYLLTNPSKENQLFKNAYTQIRHIFGGRILVIVIGHLTFAAPPILRESTAKLFTTVEMQDERVIYDSIKNPNIINKKLKIFDDLYKYKRYVYNIENKYYITTLGENERPVLILKDKGLEIAKFIK